VIAVLLVGGIGVTNAAAQAAIPGDALYPLKTTLEQTRLSLAGDAGDRAQMKIGFADERLAEIEALIKEGRFPEVSRAVLSFEADINSAILELESVSKTDPARAGRIASEITAALTRYAQALSVAAASAPESVRPEVERALDTTRIAGSLDLPHPVLASDDNSNANLNDNGDDSLVNDNTNTNLNGDDSLVNGNTNSNLNGDDHGGNVNGGTDDNSNTAGGTNSNTNGDDSGGGGGGSTNTNGDDSGGGDGGGGGGGNSNDGSGHN
jgi:hypothetical protein